MLTNGPTTGIIHIAQRIAEVIISIPNITEFFSIFSLLQIKLLIAIAKIEGAKAIPINNIAKPIVAIVEVIPNKISNANAITASIGVKIP